MITKIRAYVESIFKLLLFINRFWLKFIHKYDLKEKHKYDYKEEKDKYKN